MTDDRITTPPHRPSTMYLRAGGDPESLEQIRDRARAWLLLWLPGSPELRIREFVDYVSREIGSTAIEIQSRINAAVRAIKPDAHEATTRPIEYVCSECAKSGTKP